MNRRTVALPLLAWLAIGGCDLTDVDEVVRTQAAEFPLQGTWTAALAPAEGEALTGNTTLLDHKAYYDGVITVANGAPSTAYNWRIYTGTCASALPTIVGGTAGAFPVLETNGSGAATVARQFSSGLALRAGQQYTVRVLSGTTVESTVACGPLQPS